MIVSAAGFLPVLLERLSRDHARIAGVTRQLEVLADDLEQGADWDAFSELIGFLDYYADAVHHPLEDRVFDHLVNKGLTPTERHLVFKNLGQHEEITALTEALSRAVAQALAGETVDTADFAEQLYTYISLQRRHMRFEEQQLFPLLEQGLDNADWNALTRLVDRPERESPGLAADGSQPTSTEYLEHP